MNFTTATDAKADITAAIEATGEATATDYDVDTIFDTCFTFDAERQVFVQTADVDEFWTAVQGAAL